MKPEVAIFPKNFGGVISAVAMMCATASRTVQPVHSDGVSHAASSRLPRSSASAPRSVATTLHMSSMIEVKHRPTAAGMARE